MSTIFRNFAFRALKYVLYAVGESRPDLKRTLFPRPKRVLNGDEVGTAGFMNEAIYG